MYSIIKVSQLIRFVKLNKFRQLFGTFRPRHVLSTFHDGCCLPIGTMTIFARSITCSLPFLGSANIPDLARSTPASLKSFSRPIPAACLMSKGNVTRLSNSGIRFPTQFSAVSHSKSGSQCFSTPDAAFAINRNWRNTLPTTLSMISPLKSDWSSSLTALISKECQRDLIERFKSSNLTTNSNEGLTIIWKELDWIGVENWIDQSSCTVVHRCG